MGRRLEAGLSVRQTQTNKQTHRTCVRTLEQQGTKHRLGRKQFMKDDRFPEKRGARNQALA